MGVNEQENMLK